MYNFHHTRDNSHDNIFSQAPSENDNHLNGMLNPNSDLRQFSEDDTAPYFDNHAYPLSASAQSEIPPPMFNSQFASNSSQMMQPMWHEYDNSYTLPMGYDQNMSPYSFPDMNPPNPGSMLYGLTSPPHAYAPSTMPSPPPNSRRGLLPPPLISDPPSPSSRSPFPQPSSPHSPLSMHTPSPTSGLYPSYHTSYQAAHAPLQPIHILPNPTPGRRRLRVPQTLAAGFSSSRVEFRVNGVLGVRVQDAMRNFVDMDDGGNRILPHIGARTIRLAIHWPGCQPVGSYVNIRDDSLTVTRKEFAHRVGLAISRMLIKVAKTQSSQSVWPLGADGITMNDLLIHWVTPASQNMWIAELEAEVKDSMNT